jgi:hypothetical protein
MKIALIMSILFGLTIAQANPFLSPIMPKPKAQVANEDRVQNCIDLTGTWVGQCSYSQVGGESDSYESEVTINQIGCQYIDLQYDFIEVGDLTTKTSGHYSYSYTMDWMPGGTELTSASVFMNAMPSDNGYFRSFGYNHGTIRLVGEKMTSDYESSYVTEESGQKQIDKNTGTCTYNRI